MGRSPYRGLVLKDPTSPSRDGLVGRLVKVEGRSCYEREAWSFEQG